MPPSPSAFTAHRRDFLVNSTAERNDLPERLYHIQSPADTTINFPCCLVPFPGPVHDYTSGKQAANFFLTPGPRFTNLRAKALHNHVWDAN